MLIAFNFLVKKIWPSKQRNELDLLADQKLSVMADYEHAGPMSLTASMSTWEHSCVLIRLQITPRNRVWPDYACGFAQPLS